MNTEVYSSIDDSRIHIEYTASEWGIVTVSLRCLVSDVSVSTKWETNKADQEIEVANLLARLNKLKLTKEETDFSMKIETIDGDSRRALYTMTHNPTGKTARMSTHSTDVVSPSQCLKNDLIKQILKESEGENNEQ